MAGEIYAEKAVKSVAAWIRTGIAAQLRALEASMSLATGTLVDPSVVLEARAPLDNRVPRYEVYVETGDPIEERRHLHAWDLTIAWTWLGDADVEAGERMMMRQFAALRRLFESDYTLGGTVTVAIPNRAEFGASRGDDAATKHEFVLGLEVHTHDP